MTIYNGEGLHGPVNEIVMSGDHGAGPHNPVNEIKMAVNHGKGPMVLLMKLI